MTGERGIRSALAVQLLSAAGRLEVWHAHALLAQSEALEASSGQFVHVTVTHGEEGLTVRVGSTCLVENVTLANWSPDQSWRVGIGARTGEMQQAVHLVDNFKLRSGAGFRII